MKDRVGSVIVANMYGRYRIPTIIKYADSLSRGMAVDSGGKDDLCYCRRYNRFCLRSNAYQVQEISAFSKGQKYPNAGYGGAFFQWLFPPSSEPYNSWGNGSAMRVNPFGFAFDTIEEVLVEAQKSAEVTHNHPEGIKGAQATALAIFLARMEESKAGIKKKISRYFSYDLNRDLDEIRPQYSFDISCQGSVPASEEYHF